MAGVIEIEKIEARGHDRTIWSISHPHPAQKDMHTLLEKLQGQDIETGH